MENDILSIGRTAKQIISELNNFTDIKETLKCVLSMMQSISGCEAVGIRLEDNGDYPYYVYNGFPESFIKLENSLCLKDKNGIKKECSNGKGYLLECMCGNIIRERFDPKYEFFTEGGSFWTSNVSDLRAVDIKIEGQGAVRGRCVAEGYVSVAIIPIKSKGETIGLIQLNDKRAGMFTLERIKFFELIGQNIGLAVANSMMYSKVIENLNLKLLIEQQALKIKEAEHLEKLRTEFFANISHELRTPISVIFNSLGLLDLYREKGLFIEKSPKVNKQFDILKKNSFRLLKFINNLIDISKFDSGYTDMNISRCNIVSLLEEIVFSLSEYAVDKGLDFYFDTDVSEKYIFCDVDKIERIVLNLLSNAIKFSETEGNVTIKFRDKGDNVIISVKDTGIGIPKNKIDTVFERFSQVDKLLTRKNEGSGLGLSIVKMLVEMHGGKITVKSEYRQNTEFIIELPVESSTSSSYSEYVFNNKDFREKIADKAMMEFSDILEIN
ncbi:MAG: GAF domain-containing sensor histidine kinase [Ignavibacteriales bacterium]